MVRARMGMDISFCLSVVFREGVSGGLIVRALFCLQCWEKDE